MFIGGEGKAYFGKIIIVDTESNAGEIKNITKTVLCADFLPIKPWILAVGGGIKILYQNLY